MCAFGTLLIEEADSKLPSVVSGLMTNIKETEKRWWPQ